ncbi:flagellar export protein FliJ [Lonsdalea populi]|uniref:flagellar export protein FliJ n=1 Tax=Lonsdalea populi TaxID=1172565 RepID=UPI000A1EEE84|nr:flagellar export protein FliJ [Lonsdalea populi]OSN01714.1 flagellar protein FliJ [Lonsdalea populi]QPQ25402.1 flagella biosynthesis chaperone FliJ [Lonsdalea populi]RAT41111.1 flagellar protein FliJ [Lonsdalea populi]RAT44765.1 flagellar protein FliJ [Lonsdalea populi]RAT58064.1 flagellar protein FliJ [Lonsdalea populi]
MKTETPLDKLRELAQQEVDDAATLLGQIRQSHVQAQRQLDMLLRYEDDYRVQLQQTMSSGINSSNWYNYQQFIKTLELAIEQHRKQLAVWAQRLDQAMKTWQAKRQRLNAFETLKERAAQELLVRENRRDQKLMDEFAQRSSLRKLNP